MSEVPKLFPMFQLFFICVFIFVSFVASQECITPRNTTGLCISVKECPVILNVLQTRPLSNELISNLNQYTCDYTFDNPRVCCEKNVGPCKTLENLPGICTTINNCQNYMNLLETKPFLSNQIVNYLKKTECNYGRDHKAKVCCPFINKPKHENLIDKAEIRTDLLPKPGVCGHQILEDKLIGGNITDLGEFPWMALLEYGSWAKPVLGCGGTLISSRFVLTAAHCVMGRTVKNYGNLQRIRLGEYDIRNATDCVTQFGITDCAPPIVRIDIEKIVPHEGFSFSNKNLQDDIALIKMKRDVQFTDFIKPVCLPTEKLTLPTKFSVVGWGKTEISDQSNVKLKLTVPLFDKASCASIYLTLGSGIRLGRGQICAGGVQGQDSCTGDSGGPLLSRVNIPGDLAWYQFGVISFGPRPCGRIQPAVYTYVTEYMPWILRQLSIL